MSVPYTTIKKYWEENPTAITGLDYSSMSDAEIAKHLEAGSETRAALESSYAYTQAQTVEDTVPGASTTAEAAPETDTGASGAQPAGSSAAAAKSLAEALVASGAYATIEEAMAAVAPTLAPEKEEKLSATDQAKYNTYVEIWGEEPPEGYIESKKNLNTIQFAMAEKEIPAYQKTKHYQDQFESKAQFLASKLGGDV